MHANSLPIKSVLTGAIVLAMLACTPKPLYVSKAGVMFYFEHGVKPWNPIEVDQQEEYFLSGLASLNTPQKYATPVKLRKLRVTVTAKPFTCLICPNPTLKRAGILSNKRWAIVADMGCPFNSAYTHEMLHFLQTFEDYEHRDVRAWKIADSPAGVCSMQSKP